MFLCDKCHDVARHFEGFRSRGACEVCGAVADCIDCHKQQCDAPKPAKRPKKTKPTK